jgi:hypothetical protein
MLVAGVVVLVVGDPGEVAVAPGLAGAFGSEDCANPGTINAPAIKATLIVCKGRVICRKHLCSKYYRTRASESDQTALKM